MGKVPVTCVRVFNVLGPGQSPELVPAAFLHQIASILKGDAEEIKVGNLDTARDFTDIRDVVSALWLLLTADDRVVGEVFNVASGNATRIGDILEECIRLSGRQIRIAQDTSRMRKTDVRSICGDIQKIRRVLDWSPRLDWKQSLRDMWELIEPIP